MKILTISDEECMALWDYYMPGRLDGYDLIISCGDLKAKYLSFLVTMAKCPVVVASIRYEKAPLWGKRVYLHILDVMDADYVAANSTARTIERKTTRAIKMPRLADLLLFVLLPIHFTLSLFYIFTAYTAVSE